MPQVKTKFTYQLSHVFWVFLFSISISLNLVNYYFLDLIYTLLFILGLGSINKNFRGWADSFFFKIRWFNFFVVSFILSGILGYIIASPLGTEQIEDILNLRWILGFYACYYGGKKVYENKQELKLNPYILLFPIVAVLVIHFFRTHGQLVTLDKRLQGFYQNPNHLGLTITLLWAFIFGQTVIQTEDQEFSFLNILILVFLTVILLSTYSRTAWIGVLVAFITGLFHAKSRKLIYLSLFGLMTVLILLAFNVFGLKYRIFYSFDVSSHNSQDLRLLVWKVAWHIFKDHPFFGVGFGENVRMFPEYYSRLGLDARYAVNNTHNQFLDVLTGAGLFGLLAYLSMFFSGFLYFRKKFKYATNLHTKKVAYGAMLVIIALLGSSFTDIPFKIHESRNFILLLLGFSFGYLDNSEKKTVLENK